MPIERKCRGKEAPRDEPFDYNAEPQKFYFEVETDESLGPQDLVMEICGIFLFFYAR